MTYLETPKMPGLVGGPRWIDVVVEVDRTHPDTFATIWRVGQFADGRTFEEYKHHVIVFDEGEARSARVRIYSRTDHGARVLRYAVFELNAEATGMPLHLVEEHDPLDLGESTVAVELPVP